MKNPVKLAEFRAHSHRLRQILGRRFESVAGVTFELRALPIGGDTIQLTLQNNASTVEAINEREGIEVCGVLRTLGEEGEQRRIVCSLFEAWKAISKNRYRFDQASMTFFLQLGCESDSPTKQMFRLEWEDWEHKTPNKAAYPHWQFDRWLTASDRQSIEEMRARFQRTGGETRVFEPADHGTVGGRPNLAWFTKLHFPVNAPWAKDPIISLDDKRQAHRTLPDSIAEVEDWIDSALSYLADQLKEYAV